MSASKQSMYYTTREAAHLLGVSVRTAQLWAENGLLDAWKTGGGHRRIERRSVDELIRGRGKVPHVMARQTLDTPPEAASAASLSRAKVLVVEDDGILLRLYRKVIESWGMPVEVILAHNGVEGLIYLGRDGPDLMIVDLVMPEIDGFSLVRSLMATTFSQGMQVVVVTGLDPAEIERRGSLPHGVTVFPKPVPFAALREIVERMLARRQTYF